MTSHIYPTLGFGLPQELGSNEIIKKSRAYVVNTGGRKQEIIREISFNLKPQHLEQWKPFSSLCKSNPDDKLDAVRQAPSKSPEKTRLKPSPKKQNPKIRDREKDLHTRNHLHAWESLISLMLGSEQHKQHTMLSLKKSRGDLSDFLTQFSIGIAGTGIAVFFSVACNVASRRVPFCENKVFDSALSLSLVILSWAVSRLKKAINGVNKKAINEEEIRNRVERRIKEVYFRAAIVIAIVALRFG